MLKIKINKKELDEFIKEFDGLEKRSARSLYLTLNAIAAFALRKVQKNLTGGVLHTGTGDLYKSVEKSRPYKKGQHTAAIDVGILKIVPHIHHDTVIPTYVYGEAWETGFIYPETVVRAKYVPYLVFYWKKMGWWMRIPQVTIPQRKEAARPWFQPAIQESLPRIDKMLNAWAAEAFLRRN